jgi:hypothetical protein
MAILHKRVQAGTATEKARPDRKEIARVAYELFERRGRVDGHHLEDWHAAQAIVRSRNNKNAWIGK